MRNISSRKLHAGLVALAALSSVLVTGCSSEGIVDAPDKVPLTLTATIEGPATKSVSSTLQDAAFDIGEQVSVEIGGTVYPYTTGANGVLNGTNPYYISSSSPAQVIIMAWYPADAFESSTSYVEFTVESDQSSDENYKKSDLMAAVVTATYSNPSPILGFNHKLTKIVANIDCSITGIEKSAVAKVEMIGICPRAYITQKSYRVTDMLNGHYDCTANLNVPATDIVMKDPTVGNSSTSVAAIIPPQTITAGTAFFRVTIDGKEYTAVLDKTNDYTFKAGYEYIFNIVLGSAQATVSEYKVGAWNAGNYTDEDRTGESIWL